MRNPQIGGLIIYKNQTTEQAMRAKLQFDRHVKALGTFEMTEQKRPYIICCYLEARKTKFGQRKRNRQPSQQQRKKINHQERGTDLIMTIITRNTVHSSQFPLLHTSLEPRTNSSRINSTFIMTNG